MSKITYPQYLILVYTLSLSVGLVPQLGITQPNSFVANTGTAVLVGFEAPHFTVSDMNGKTHSTNELVGKKNLLVTFFPKCFTFNCTNQITSLRDVYAQLRENDIEVWGVSTDEAEGIKGQKAYAHHLKLPFLLIPDPSRKICLLYGAVNDRKQMAARMSIFIDKHGIVRWIDKQMYPPTHGKDVLTRLKNEGFIRPTKHEN
ncbi:MAG: peroxiredoxin family protein [Proteobacteria bacterium]|nr:MAG: peroxiredoxin family protein [Pseudomonadota bacterium]